MCRSPWRNSLVSNGAVDISIQAGTLRDMMPNHILQLGFSDHHGATDFRSRRMRCATNNRKILHAMQPIQSEDVLRALSAGQYGAG